MAPHDTNPKKEVRRHAGPLIGISAVLLLVLVGLIWWLSSVFSGPDPNEPSSTIEVPAADTPQSAEPQTLAPSADAPSADGPSGNAPAGNAPQN